MLIQKPLPTISEIKRRLQIIFSDSISDRNYVTNEVAAKTVFVMLYIDAIEGGNILLAPKHVYRMSTDMSNCQEDNERRAYYEKSKKKGYRPVGKAWYEDNTRESIRDDTIRDGFIQKGVVIKDHSVPTTSNKGRYTLKRSFAKLFIARKDDFEKESRNWIEHNLNASELAKIKIIESRQTKEASINVLLPNGTNRILSAGPSSIITKAVIEDFTALHLVKPEVLWISESSKKVIFEDDELMKDIGLVIDKQKLLPDIVLADLGKTPLQIIFIEVVATDGPITESRKKELYSITDKAGFPRASIVFISAYEQRGSTIFKKRFSAIAVDSLIWCTSEPQLLIWLGKDKEFPIDLK